MIEIIDVSKTFKTEAGNVEALKNVSLTVEQSDIYGLIGYSGAGKSTLLRCINLLERPDSGKIIVEGVEITGYTQAEIEKARQGIGMIFQNFNLLRSKTVFENIAFPLRYLGKSNKFINERVKELIELVGLGDKTDNYPAQLSGGQKQRVAIARALANSPNILLSDEATSALDAHTTESILHLLLELNHKLNLTIVIVTHELHVVKEICNKIAVMENGNVVECGTAYNLFSSPQENLTRGFMDGVFKVSTIEKLLSKIDVGRFFGTGGILVHLMFTDETGYTSYIAQVINDFNIDVNIFYGNIEQIQSILIGSLFVIINGDRGDIDAALDYLKVEGVGVNVLHDEFVRKGVLAC